MNTVISYTKPEREQINAAWTKLTAFAEVNGNDGSMELGKALMEHRRTTGRDTLSVKAQLLGLLVRAGDVRFDRLFMYTPPARTVIAYSWWQHRRFMDGETRAHNGVTWDELLIAGQDAQAALNQYLERKHKVELGEEK